MIQAHNYIITISLVSFIFSRLESTSLYAIMPITIRSKRVLVAFAGQEQNN